jgi:3-methyladenine DNA glycosylase Tag
MKLTPFNKIRKLAEDRKGGPEALDELLANPYHRTLTPKQLAKLGDDRYLSTMTRCVFNSGFNWKVVEHMWKGFEEAFHAFNPKGLAHLAPEKWDAYVEDRRIVRHGKKIRSVLDNAHFVWSTSEEHGSFGKHFAAWPADDQIGLMHWLKKEGSRLGGSTAMYFIRSIGRDGFILSLDVATRLRASGVEIAEHPTSKRDLKLAQEAFNQWHDETGLSYTELSRTLGMSVGPNYGAAALGGEEPAAKAEKAGKKGTPAKGSTAKTATAKQPAAAQTPAGKVPSQKVLPEKAASQKVLPEKAPSQKAPAEKVPTAKAAKVKAKPGS